MSQDPLYQDAGQLLIVGFPEAPRRAPEFITRALADGQISGCILFRRNVDDVDQVIDLTESIHAAVGRDGEVPFVALDQEGGRVVRLREPLTPIPPMRLIGEYANTELASLISEVVATEVGALGFNLNFAPVLDVDTNPDNPVIGDRSFSSDPQQVARYGGAWMAGHTIAGVLPCAKHFPGHGDTNQDSHLALPTITHDLTRLTGVELHPFRRLVRAHIPMIMTAHIVVASIDPIYPATLSEDVIGGLLRDKIDYDGVVVSDCLEMKAVADHFSIEEMVERGVRAGVDLFLICHTEEKWRRAHAHLVKTAREDEAFAKMLRTSAERVRKLKRSELHRLGKPWTRHEGWRDVLGCHAHRATLERLQAKADVGIDPTEP